MDVEKIAPVLPAGRNYVREVFSVLVKSNNFLCVYVIPSLVVIDVRYINVSVRKY